MNNKSLKKILIYVFMAVAFFMVTISSFSMPKKASAAEHQYYPTKILELDKIGTFNYYYASSGEMKDFVGLRVVYSVVGTGNNTYKYTHDEFWSINESASGSDARTPTVYMYAKLADHILTASKNGYASITANADLKTSGGHYCSIVWKEDLPDKVYAKLSSGTNGSTSTLVNAFDTKSSVDYSGNGFTDTEYRAVSITMSKVEYSYVMLSAYTEYVSTGGLSTSSNTIHIRRPSFTVSSTDTSAPQISFSSSNDGWTNGKKTITLNITDGQAGIRTVTYGGKTLAFSEISADTKTAKTSIDITENGTYSFNVTDNVGNTKTYTYTESKIEKTAPTFSLNVPEMVYGFNLDFSATFGAYESPETFYYTIDGSIPTKSSTPLSASNQLTLSGYGHYVIKAKGFDEAGNESSVLEYEFNCVYDGEYSITTSTNGGTISDGIDGVTGVNEYLLEFDTGEDYSLYKVLVNGVEKDITISGTIIKTYEPTDIEIVCRKVVTLYNEKTYVYNPLGTAPDFSVSEQGLTFSDFTVEFIKDGIKTSFGDAGEYTINYSISTENYVGSGSFIVVIEQKEIEVIEVVENYEYQETFNFTYEVNENASYVLVKFTLDGEEVTPLKPATYGYEFTSTNANYKVVKSGTLVIDKKTVSLSVSGITEFDGEEHLPIISAQEGLEYTFTLTFKGESVDKLYKAGDYSYTLSINENELYKGEISGVLSVAKRNITISADNISSEYGSSIKELTYSVTNGVSALPEFELIKEEGEVVGSYDIIVTPKDLEDYEITYVNGVYTITKKAVYVVAVEGQYKYYGDSDNTIKYSAIGLVGSDTLSGSLERELGENVGLYNIEQGTLSNPNYEITFVNSVFKILHRQIVVKAVSTQKTFGDVDPEITTKLLYGSLVEGDYVLATREQGENAGEYAVSEFAIYNASGEDITDNYLVIPIVSNFKINKKPITVTATPVEITYGESGTLEYVTSIDGVVLDGEITREQGENVGEYQILIGTLSSENYEIEFVSATYKINKKALIVTADEISKVYGEQTSLTYQTQGLIGGDSLSGSLGREEGENVGEYQILIGTLSNPNYEIEFIGSILTITPAPLTIAVDDASKVYGEEDLEFTYSVTGILGEDQVEVTLSREQGENAGEYAISVEQISNENYYLESSTNGVLTIEKATFDFEVFAKTVVYNGLVQGIDLVETDKTLVYEYYLFGNKVEPKDVNEYEVKVIFDGGENYHSVEKTTTLTIVKKRVVIVVDCNPVKYTGSIVSPVYTLKEDIPVIVEWENGSAPIEKGEYAYTITADDGNRYVEFSGVLVIE